VIVDTTTGEIIDVKRRMTLSDLNRPMHQRPAAWIHESHSKGYRVTRPAQRPRTYARARRPERQAHLLKDLLEATVLVLIAGGVLLTMYVGYGLMYTWM
jgi:hypothetical protein